MRRLLPDEYFTPSPVRVAVLAALHGNHRLAGQFLRKRSAGRRERFKQELRRRRLIVQPRRRYGAGVRRGSYEQKAIQEAVSNAGFGQASVQRLDGCHSKHCERRPDDRRLALLRLRTGIDATIEPN